MIAAQILHAAGIAMLVVAGGTSAVAIVTSIAPQWRRIVCLALGHVEPATTPVPRGARTEAIRL